MTHFSKITYATETWHVDDIYLVLNMKYALVHTNSAVDLTPLEDIINIFDVNLLKT